MSQLRRKGIDRVAKDRVDHHGWKQQWIAQRRKRHVGDREVFTTEIQVAAQEVCRHAIKDLLVVREKNTRVVPMHISVRMSVHAPASIIEYDSL